MSESKPNEIPNIPELAAEYDLIRELGRGGTAVVYLARERDLGRDVAIKLIRPAYVRDEDAVARLVREARTVGKLQHPSIVMLLGTRRLGDRGLALILQYVPGSTLKDRIRTAGALPFDQVERILKDLAQALAYAHTHRIVHRDIKPENVYLDDSTGLARLADFGLARGWDSDSGLTMPGTAIGTPTYMSPEQIEGKDLDGRSDLYSLGLVGFEALTGRQPWAGESLYTIIYKQKYEDLPPVRKLRPGVPRNLAVAIEGATRKKPDERWRNAHEFLSALEGRISSPPAKAVASAPPPTGEALPSAQYAEGPTPSPVPSKVPATAGATPRGRSAGPASAPTPAKRRRRGLRVALALAATTVAATFFSVRAAPEGRVARFVGALTSFADNLEVSPGATSTDPGRITENGGPATTEGTLASPGTLSVTDPLPQGEDAALDPTAALAARVPDSILVLGGNEQVGVARGILPLPVGLRVVDDARLGVGEVPVVFEVVSGSGTVEPDRGVTGVDGSVYARWTLGDAGVQQTVRARTETAEPLEIVFSAEALPPTAQRVEIVRGADQEGRAGETLPTPIELRILDGAGGGGGGDSRWGGRAPGGRARSIRRRVGRGHRESGPSRIGRRGPGRHAMDARARARNPGGDGGGRRTSRGRLDVPRDSRPRDAGRDATRRGGGKAFLLPSFRRGHGLLGSERPGATRRRLPQPARPSEPRGTGGPLRLRRRRDGTCLCPDAGRPGPLLGNE
ncbi:MAG: protein kinase [Gemmatimonadota bacterium]